MQNTLRISNHNVIESNVLKDLSKINIICGPNNSGKSTLLEVMASDTYRHFAIENINEASEIIYNLLILKTGWAGAPHYPLENIAFKEVIQKTLNSKPYWFSDEDEAFGYLLAENFRLNNQIKSFGFPGAHVNKAFSKLKKTYRAILIPAKRQLERIVQINSDEEVSPDGKGLINFLFYAKNQPITSENRKLYIRINTVFQELTDGVRFEIFINTNKLFLNFSPNENLWLSAEQCGLGLQDLLLIIYFAENTESEILCLEEPESHLHPDIQRKILFYLSKNKKKQFFISTHSNIFLDNAFIDKVIITKFSEGKIHLSDVTSKASLLDDLGYSVTDNLVSDLVILVEGPTDVPVIEELLLKKGLLGKYGIKIWPLGGDIMDQLDLSVFVGTANLIALLDKDPGSAKVRKRFAKTCSELNIPLIVLKRYAIENYFTLDALKEIYKSQIPASVTSLDNNKKLESQININVKKKNRIITRLMSLNDVDGTDLADFLNEVEDLCKNN